MKYVKLIKNIDPSTIGSVDGYENESVVILEGSDIRYRKRCYNNLITYNSMIDDLQAKGYITSILGDSRMEELRDKSYLELIVLFVDNNCYIASGYNLYVMTDNGTTLCKLTCQ